MRGCASKLACGRRIDPAEQAVFTELFGEFVTASRANVGIGPYKAHTKGSPYRAGRGKRRLWYGRPLFAFN